MSYVPQATGRVGLGGGDGCWYSITSGDWFWSMVEPKRKGIELSRVTALPLSAGGVAEGAGAK